MSVSADATAREMDNAIAVYMAGRAAEQLVFGDVSVGSGGGPQSDLAMATELARQMEFIFGMGELGTIYLVEGVNDPLMLPGAVGSVRRRIEYGLARATNLLLENRDMLDRIASELFRTGYLSGADIHAILDATRPRGHKGCMNVC